MCKKWNIWLFSTIHNISKNFSFQYPSGCHIKVLFSPFSTYIRSLWSDLFSLRWEQIKLKNNGIFVDQCNQNEITGHCGSPCKLHSFCWKYLLVKSTVFRRFYLITFCMFHPVSTSSLCFVQYVSRIPGNLSKRFIYTSYICMESGALTVSSEFEEIDINLLK